MKNSTLFCSALILALGLTAAGWLAGRGFMLGRAAERFVTVKGISERDVTADLALWPIRFVSTHDDLGRAQAKIQESKEEVLAFLQKQGIDPATVEIQKLEVTDQLALPYRTGPLQSRFIIAQTLMVRSDDPQRIRKASQALGDLVQAGVVVSSEGRPATGPTYLFTRLTDLKPGMIAEATANARKGAEQFAKDSGSRLGRIRQARQGIFQILARDRAPGIMEETQPQKTVRVVSTVEYYLDD